MTVSEVFYRVSLCFNVLHVLLREREREREREIYYSKCQSKFHEFMITEIMWFSDILGLQTFTRSS